MYTPFVYSIAIFDPIFNKKRWYIGVRYARGCQPSDLWTKYFTSSSIVKKLIDEHGISKFTIKIVKKFATAEEARLYEKLLVQRARRFGFRLNHELINGSVPGDKWPITTGIAPPNKGLKNKDFMDPIAYQKCKELQSKPKKPESMTKMVATRRSRGTYDGGEKHPRARVFILTSPDGTLHRLNGTLKAKCLELNLSWQALYKAVDKGVIHIDRTKHKNLTRLGPKFHNTIGWKLDSIIS